MNSTRRFVVRTGSAVALLVLLATTLVRADSANYTFQNQTLSFSHLVRTPSGTAVGVNDPGFRALLKSMGATLTWRPGERYVLISTPQPLVLNFALGQKRYDAGLLSANAAFAPFAQGSEAYLPFDDLMRALSLAVKDDGGTQVLQPQLTAVDLQGTGSQAIVVAHAAVALHPKMLTDAPDRLVYAFDGVASSIDGNRIVDAGGIKAITVSTGGSVRAPRTTITLTVAPNTRHDAPHSNNGDFEVAFGANGGAPPLVASNSAPAAPTATQPASNESPAQPLVTPAPLSTSDGSSGASVTGVSVQPTSTGTTVVIAVTGNATYEWHRLRDPDNRFWIDIKNAQLNGGPKDETEPDPLIAIRSRQLDAQTVRVAISLNGAKQLSVSPSATGVVIAVGRDVAAEDVRSGTGSIGSVVSANEPQTLVTPVPADMYGQNPSSSGDDTWKFGASAPLYVPTNPKLIVIDPGHGGGDRGAIRNGSSEAELNLQMAKRLQQLLIARGWQVKLTRSDDNDVLATPRSSAEAEALGYTSSAAKDLQAREDIANNAGARLMVSIHCNSFINSGPSGTTTYYSKASDLPFAQIVSRVMAANLGTKNDGIVKSHLYIPQNAHMPTVLIETAFLSNPSDYEKLVSPDWQQRVAEDIADGIDRYAAQYPVTGSAQ